MKYLKKANIIMKGVCLDCSFQDIKSKIGWPHWFVSGKGILAELDFMAGEPVYGKDHIQTGNQYKDKFRGPIMTPTLTS